MREDYYNDLNHLLDYSKRRQWQWQIFLDALTFATVGLATYYLVNYAALNIRFDYIFSKHQAPVSSIASSTIGTGQGGAGDGAIEHPLINVPDDVPENGIYISKIDIKAPITWNGQADNIQELLKKGVAHIAGSATPGMTGNVFLTGHSSELPWADGDYKTVFALLDKLENGDEIIVRIDKQNYLYKVYNKQVTGKDEVGGFVKTDKKESITIMTCYPVGSSLKRLIVQAERQGQ